MNNNERALAVGSRCSGQYLITHADHIPNGTVVMNIDRSTVVPAHMYGGFWIQNGVTGGVIDNAAQYKVLHVPELTERDQLIQELDHAISSGHVNTAIEQVADFILENFQRKTDLSEAKVLSDNDGEFWFRNDDGTYRYEHARSGTELHNFSLSRLEDEYGPLTVVEK